MASISDYEKRLNNNPKSTILKGLLWLFGIVILFSTLSYGFGWFSEAAAVAKEEFGAKASLKKYEWFKDASETILEKKQTILVYQTNVDQMKKDYSDTKRKDWDRIDKQQYNQWSLEIVGLKASYNKVVKEYNAQSSKFNWKIYNTSDLPVTYNMYLSK